MSDDQRLFDSFGRTLAVILQNVRFRDLQQSQQERERQLLVLASRAELKALRAQINPHFLFNALNAIAGLIPTDPALADQTVEELGKVFRYTLRKSESEWVGLDEEAEFVRAYLRVERARFGDRLWTQVCVEPAAAQVPIPAMCVQPLIENAVRHGASLASGRGLVELRASVEGQFLLVEVSDNGPGFPARFSLAGSTGHGLRNVSERLAGYYGDLAQLRWESSDGRTWVRLRIPCPVPAEVGRGDSDARRDRR
jgi:LytS/YehU family sensor histidine kinase